MISEIPRSRIPSELSAEEVRAIRGDERLQRIIADAYGLTASSVSLIKARRCRGDVSNTQPVAPKPLLPEINVTICPPARAAGHKPITGERLKHKAFSESGKLSQGAMRAAHIEAKRVHTDTPSISDTVQHYADDWFIL